MSPETPNSPIKRTSAAALATVGICAALLIVFAIISGSAASTKSTTYDEPLHLVSGMARRTTGDFVMDAEDPSLFGYWATLPFAKESMPVRFDLNISPELLRDPNHTYQWGICVATLYRTPGTDGDLLIQESRWRFIIVGLLLAALIAWWSWQLAGAAAAIIASAFFAFDPNFLAHSALVKNDVPFSFAFLALSLAIWQFGKRGTWLSLAGIALACGLSLNVKFSGVLCGPVIFLTLLIRALLPQPWVVLNRTLNFRGQRLFVVPVVCIIVGIVSWVTIWACYDFRFVSTTSNSPLPPLDTPTVVERIKRDRVAAHGDGDIGNVTAEMIHAEPQGAISAMVAGAESMHLLPHAWLWGFLYTYATTILRNSYLLGQVGYRGWWYYFPCVMLFKTPTATLIAILAAAAGLAWALIGAFARPRNSESQRSIDWWPAAGIGVPAMLYFLSAMASTMNLGLRHILPVYPFLYLMIGAGLGSLIKRFGHVGIILTGLLVFALMVEMIAAYPNYIAFFNAPSASSAGGLNLLGDSNLDWGQDLKLLAQWQKQAPNKKLYLCYFGTGDPEFYGVRATYMPGGWQFATTTETPPTNEPCYVAISATSLQGIFYPPESRQAYQPLLDYYPVAILGGSIYIYEFPFSPQMRKPHR